MTILDKNEHYDGHSALSFEDMYVIIREAGLKARDMAREAETYKDELSMAVFYGQAALAAYILEAISARHSGSKVAKEAFAESLDKAMKGENP